MSSQPRQSAPTPTSDTSSAPESSQQITANDGYERQTELYEQLEAEYLRDATGDAREEAS